MFKATLTNSLSGQLGRSYTVPVEVEAEARVGLLNEAAPEATTVIACALDVSKANLLAMTSSRDVVVKVNDAGAPDNTFTLVANVPFLWAAPQGALKDTADAAVTIDFVELHIVNAGLVAAEFQLDAFFDPTA